MYMMMSEGNEMADAFDASKVTKIYLGKDRHCRCGCGGEYVDRGEPLFEKCLRRFVAKWATYEPKEFDNEVPDCYLNYSYGKNRALTVYFD
jgi:hypothetical protein